MSSRASIVLERLDRPLGAPVGLRLVVEGGRAGDPEVVDLGLVVGERTQEPPS